MGVKSTHTFVELELSPAAYDEIANKLRAAGYDHAFMDGGAIDMHGIGVMRKTELCGDEGCPHYGTPHVCVSK